MSSQKKSVVIDTSNSIIDVYIKATDERSQLNNNNIELQELSQKLSLVQPEIIVVKTTEKLPIKLIVSLLLAELSVTIINDLQITKFKEEIGNDLVESKLLETLADLINPLQETITDRAKFQLNESMSIRDQVLEMISTEQNRLLETEAILKPTLQEHILWLEDKLKEIDEQLELIIKENTLSKIPDLEILKESLSQDNKSISITDNNSNHNQEDKQSNDEQINSKKITQNEQQKQDVPLIPTKKVTKKYRGQVYEEEVPDYAAIQQLKQNQQKPRRKYRGQYID